MTNTDRLPSEAEHLIFNGSVSHRKSIVLALVFRPGIDEEGLHIDPRGEEEGKCGSCLDECNL
jgi:hypothetical protein